MPLKTDRLVDRIRLAKDAPGDPNALGMVPCPDLDGLRKKGTAAIDLRLGRWFLTLRQSRATLLEVKEVNDESPALPSLAEHFVNVRKDVAAMTDGPDKKTAFSILRCLIGDIKLDKLRRELETEELARDADHPARLGKYHFVQFGDRFILHPGEFVLGITVEWLKLPANLSAFVTGKSKWGRRGLIIETAPGIHPGFCGCLTLELGNVGRIPVPLIPGIEICQIFFENAEGDSTLAESQFELNRRPVLGDIRIDRVVEDLRKRI
jgi:deoxycytidine triphosphate deaminase